MIPTLQIFTRALLTPDLCLRTLSDARAITEDNAMPRLSRTTRFAEAEISWHGERWLLAMPLTPAALPRIERTASALKRLNSAWIADYRILPRELRWLDASQAEQTCDLVLQHLPAGCDFAEALHTESGQTLLSALDALEAELRRLGITHNNLKATNLRWCSGRFIPLRYHDAHLGEPGSGDLAGFDALREQIAQSSGTQEVHDVSATYTARKSLPGHLWASNTFEGLICVEDPAGYGFVDMDNNPVIAAQYLWAGDFHEGRAEVQTPEGMGLIDRMGNYVIAPEYEIVDYDPAESIVRVRLDGRWALFDYLGRRLTEFGTNHVREQNIPETIQ